MREYELVYILDPDLTEEVLVERMERFHNLANNQGAEIRSQERWERRRLAYEIDGKREGIYVVMELNASPAAVAEMDRILKITEGVLRHLIVRLPVGKAATGRILTQPPQAEFGAMSGGRHGSRRDAAPEPREHAQPPRDGAEAPGEAAASSAPTEATPEAASADSSTPSEAAGSDDTVETASSDAEAVASEAS